MRERVGALVGPVAQKMWVSTFHSACVRILRRDADKLGYPKSFTIYDQADAVRLTGYVIRDLNLDTKRFPPRSVHAAISAAKNDHIGVDAYTERAQVIFERKIADVYSEYQARLLQGRRHGLRRPAVGHRRRCSSATPRCSSTTAAASATCSSTSTRTPTRSRTSSSCCSPPSTATSASSATPTSAIYEFRGADIREHPRVRGGVPGRDGDRARAELPVDADDPRRRQRGHRQQHGPQAEGAVDRPGRRRGHRPVPRRRRGRRGAVGGARDVEAARRRRLALGRHGGLLPDQRAEPRRSRSS